MTKAYTCPWCDKDIEVDFNVNHIDCPECEQPINIEWDAEFTNGMWHDLTKLIKDEA